MQYVLRSSLFFTCLMFIQPLFSQSSELLDDEGWELKKEKHDVEVFSKSVDGYKIKAFKAVTIIRANIDEIYDVIMDIEDYPDWYPDCEKGEMLEEIGIEEHLRRTVFDLPWPFESRDAISRAIGTKNGNQVIIELTNEADKHPVDKKVVRIPRLEGYWSLSTVEEGTKVVYCAVGDAPGVPAWVVNLFVFDGPLDALNNLREIVR